MTDLIWLDNEPEALRGLTHYVYTDAALEDLRRDGSLTPRQTDALHNRVFPGLVEHTSLYLYAPANAVPSGMSRNDSRNRTLGRALPHFDCSTLWSRGTSLHRTRVVDTALAPWAEPAKPAFDPKTASPKALRKALKQAQKAHQADVQTIGREFLAEANQRGLCGEYDTVIQRINGGLTVKMPVRVTVTVTGTVVREDSFSIVVASDATDEEIEAAAKAARPDFEVRATVRR